MANPTLRPCLNPTPSAIQIIDRVRSKPPKCFLDTEADVAEWILEPLADPDRAAFTASAARDGAHAKALHKSFDCSIMDLADDIGFGVHDLEDALALDLIDEGTFRAFVTEEAAASFLDRLKERYPAEFGNNVYEGFVSALFGEGDRRKRFISRMVHHLIVHCRVETRDAFKEPMIRYRATMDGGPAALLEALKCAVREAVILNPSVQQLEFKGQKMVVSVFEALASEPKSFLPKDTYARWQTSPTPMRVICDHIAGMTDAFLLKTYDRLFSPRMGSVFDRL